MNEDKIKTIAKDENCIRKVRWDSVKVTSEMNVSNVWQIYTCKLLFQLSLPLMAILRTERGILPYQKKHLTHTC